MRECEPRSVLLVPARVGCMEGESLKGEEDGGGGETSRGQQPSPLGSRIPRLMRDLQILASHTAGARMTVPG